MGAYSSTALALDSFTTLPIWAQLTTRLANIWLLTLFSQTAVIKFLWDPYRFGRIAEKSSWLLSGHVPIAPLSLSTLLYTVGSRPSEIQPTFHPNSGMLSPMGWVKYTRTRRLSHMRYLVILSCFLRDHLVYFWGRKGENILNSGREYSAITGDNTTVYLVLVATLVGLYLCALTDHTRWNNTVLWVKIQCDNWR